MSQRPVTRRYAMLLIGVAWGVVVVLGVFDYTRHWTNFWDGVLPALFHMLFLVVPLALAGIPVLCGLVWIARRACLSRWRATAVILSPVIFLLMYVGADWIRNPVNHRSAFRAVFQFDLPAGANVLHSVREGGGIVDITHIYYLAADPAVVTQFLVAKPFSESDDGGISSLLKESELPADWTSASGWQAARSYRFWDAAFGIEFGLLVDGSDRYAIAYAFGI